MAARLVFEGVERRYGQMHALSSVTLSVEPGEVLCLLGASGCGKTTLLRLAAGIDKPTGGRILIGNLEVAGPDRFVPPEARNVGLMFQDFALFPHLSNLKNVAFGLKSLPRAEAKRIAMSLLERVGLAHHAHKYPHALSGGEQQRVAMMRALAPRPSVMLMDEPFSGLDVLLRASVREETLTLLRETRATTIIVTHDPEDAMRIADRIAVLRAGRVVQEGKAETLYSAPADLDVARLFSEINEVEVTVRSGLADCALVRVPAQGLADGERAVLCIRQRAVEVAEAGSGHPARVIDVKFLGDAGVVTLSVAGLDEPLRARLKGQSPFVKGEEVGLRVDPATALLFPAPRREN